MSFLQFLIFHFPCQGGGDIFICGQIYSDILVSTCVWCCGATYTFPNIFQEPVEDQGEGDASCCCISGMVNAKFKINKTGFVPGETIFVSGSIKNDSNAPVIDVGAKLVQVRR